MNTAKSLRRVSALILVAAFAQACGAKGSSRDDSPAPTGGPGKPTVEATPSPAPGQPHTPTQSPNPGQPPQPGQPAPAPTGPTPVNAQLVLSLANFDSDVATDEQALQVLSLRCQSCHGAQSGARWNLTVLPSPMQWAEIKRRVELDVGTPGHMPIGVAISGDEKASLVGWLDQRLAPPTDDPFFDYAVTIDAQTPEKIAPGRFVLPLGQRAAGQLVSFEVTITGKDQIARVTTLAGLPVPSDGIVYQTVTVEPRDTTVPALVDRALRASSITDTSLRLAWSAATDDRPTEDLTYALSRDGQIVEGVQAEAGGFFADVAGLAPGQSYGFAVIVRDLSGNETAYLPLRATTTGPVETHLDLRLTTTGSQLVPDGRALELLKNRCQTCHNPQNPPRWDLTVLPLRANWAEITRRINLDEHAIGHMPMGAAMPRDELGTLNRWFAEQQSPADIFAGYTVRAFDGATNAELTAAPLSQGRTRIALGLRRPAAALKVKVLVTGADGIAQNFAVPLTVAANGASLEGLAVFARDSTAPVVTTPTLRAADLTATSVTVSLEAATDDRPTQHLTYLMYRSDVQQLDSLDEITQHGVRVGSDLSGTGALSVDVAGLEASRTYYFNVVVRDRTGNESVYAKLSVLTLPLVFCEEIQQIGSIRAWRNGLVQRIQLGAIADGEIVEQVNRCFPTEKPQCVERVVTYAQRDDVAPSGSDGTIEDVPQKRPPNEIKDAVTGKYWIPDDIEQIAKDKGWTSVRYKSRHAGGFDSGTPNLLMVYVPGDKVSPPVKFDRWLNFPLPQDDDEPASGLPQSPRPKFGPPSREDYALPNSFPSTFTMVSQDRAEDGKPAVVYFQMFGRGNGYTFEPRGAVGMRGCVSCHPNGLRAISPLGYHVREGEERLPDEDWKAVELINRMMVERAGFKAATWGEGLTNGEKKPLYRAERGPIMGPAAPANGISRKPAFILGGTINGQQVDGCFKRRSTITVRDIFGRSPGMYEPTYKFKLSPSPVIDANKVISAMNCEGCHVNGQRWPINEDTGIAQVQFKVLVDQSMPLGMHLNPREPGNDTDHVVDHLTPDERFALVNCLEAEFELERANLDKWLKQVDCQQ